MFGRISNRRLRNHKWVLTVVTLFALLITTVLTVSAITGGQVDDFEDGTTQNWEHGTAGSPNPPTNIPDGGPAGVGDNYLENTSTGGGGPGSRMAVINRTQWTGDYAAAGVIEVSADAANFGATDLSLRFGFEAPTPSLRDDNTGGGEQWISTNAINLPADGVWYSVSFMIDESAMTQVFGVDTFDNALMNVTQARFISADIIAWRGDAIVGNLGLDNITAVTAPSSVSLNQMQSEEILGHNNTLLVTITATLLLWTLFALRLRYVVFDKAIENVLSSHPKFSGK